MFFVSSLLFETMKPELRMRFPFFQTNLINEIAKRPSAGVPCA